MASPSSPGASVPTLVSLLQQECSYRPDADSLESLLAQCDTRTYSRNEVIINTGEVNDNIYIVDEGIIRIHYLHGDKEITFGFGIRATVFLSPVGYYMRQPAFMTTSACTRCVVKVIKRVDFERFAIANLDLERWFHSLWMHQLSYAEKKLEVINGNIAERYRSMVKNRPEIIRAVPARVIASYLGVSPEYLSRIRKGMLSDRH